MKLSLNLASRSYVNEQALKWVGGVLIFLLLILLFFQLRTYFQDRQLNIGYRANIKKLELELHGKVPEFTAEQIATQQLEYSRAEALLQKDAFRWTALFDRFEGLLPKNVSIQSFNPNYKSGSLVFTGVAKKLNDLQELLDNLHADRFEQVLLQNQSQVEVIDYADQKRSALAFSIKLEGVF